MTPLLSTSATNHGCIENSSCGRIPSEVWSMIFLECHFSQALLSLTDKLSKLKNGLADPRLAPMTFASVCLIWRHTACNTPKLWTSCWLSSSHPELNKLWLGRTGAQKLDLYGIFPREMDLTSFIPSILPSQNRWESFELEAWSKRREDDNIPHPILQFDTPSLRTFSIRGIVPFWTEHLLRNSPQLHKLDLDGLNFDLPTRYLSSLSSLTLHRIAMRIALQSLARLPQLKHFSASLLDPLGAHITMAPVLTHNNLLSLSLAGIFGDEPFMVNNLVLPSLCKLYLLNEYAPRLVISLVHTSGCRLTNLCIGDSMCAEDWSVIEMLEDDLVSSRLEKLEFCFMSQVVTPALFEFLLNTDIAPHLTEFAILGPYVYAEKFPDGLVADFVISRCSSRICDCEDCLRAPQPREVQLQYTSIGVLDKETHSLDIARLVPLPGDETKDPKGAMMILDVDFARKLPPELITRQPRCNCHEKMMSRLDRVVHIHPSPKWKRESFRFMIAKPAAHTTETKYA